MPFGPLGKPGGSLAAGAPLAVRHPAVLPVGCWCSDVAAAVWLNAAVCLRAVSMVGSGCAGWRWRIRSGGAGVAHQAVVGQQRVWAVAERPELMPEVAGVFLQEGLQRICRSHMPTVAACCCGGDGCWLWTEAVRPDERHRQSLHNHDILLLQQSTELADHPLL